MITVLVRYKLPEGTTRETARETAAAAAPKFREPRGLNKKYFLFQQDEGYGGGFYIWNSRAEAEAFFTPAWADGFARRTGARPEVTYFETMVVVDNTAGEIEVDAA